MNNTRQIPTVSGAARPAAQPKARGTLALAMVILALAGTSACSASGAEAWDWTKDFAGAAFTDVGKALFYLPKGLVALALLALSLAARIVPAALLAAAAGTGTAAVVAAVAVFRSRLAHSSKPAVEVFRDVHLPATVLLAIPGFLVIAFVAGLSRLYEPSLASHAATVWNYCGF